MLSLGIQRFMRRRVPGFRRFCTVPDASSDSADREDEWCWAAVLVASELEYELLLARDLKLLQPGDYQTLSQQTVEIKRMLTVLVQKLTAQRQASPHTRA